MPSPHRPVNGASSFVQSLRLGYGVVKTLNYINEPRDVNSVNINSQSNSGISQELSPRKRRARGMFNDDDTSPEVIVQPQQVLFHFIITISLNLRAIEKGIIQSLLLLSIIILRRTINVHIFPTSNNK
jgi:hypothetical protein